MKSARLPSIVFAALAVLLYPSCTSAPTDARIGVRTPDPAQFPVVADLLVRRCGSLDCHGKLPRNLRMYGRYGLRLDPMNTPANPLTTPDEYDATFRSVVGLEPALMTAVVEKQSESTLLTIVRKARGTEDHKGGMVFAIGDAADVCLASWLSTTEAGKGSINADACKKASELAKTQ
ncbi:MAG: hypothetical protein ABIP39_01205 [Polyangiaceae bacterium]